VQCLAGVGDPRLVPNAPADGLHVSRARAGFRTAEFLNQRGIFVLRISYVARIQIPERLGSSRSERKRSRGEHEDFSTHLSHPSFGFASN
jgi:hypothetical protein